MRWCRAAAVACAVLALAACGSAGPPDLRPVPLPDLSASDASVQAQLRDEHRSVLRKQREGVGAAGMGAAFGQLAMLFHAAEYFDAAEAGYLNAQTLVPEDPRWPYYLGRLFSRTGDHERSAAAFSRAVALQPSDVASLYWLARTYLDRGRDADAEPLLVRAQSLAPREAAVLAALGQSALARGDNGRAASLLEEGLASNPRAVSLHAPLAAAYRALGHHAKADAHLARWKDVEIAVRDPREEQLGGVLRSAISFEWRGVQALDARDWTGAAEIFRGGLQLTAHDTPIGRSLRHKLGIALYLGGDLHGALREFEEAVRLAPAGGHDEPASRVHYSLGIVMASSGAEGPAVEHLTRAVAYDATVVPARLALADALRRQQRDADALPHYQAAIRLDPQAGDARLGHALALVRLRRWVDARSALEEALAVQPDRLELTHALARVLAAAPDARARDGYRAALLVDELFKVNKRTELGETMAMTLAELGDYDKAAAIQRGVIDAARRAGLEDDVRRMTGNLRLYERRQPCRTPWPDDDPIHRPGPPIVPQLAALIGNREASS